jgi:hypothetical protein
MKKFFNFMHKYAAVLFLICALTAFLSKEYTSSSLWVSLFLLELTNRDEDTDNKSQSEDGSTKENK